MRLFADQDVYAITVSFLASQGHEVQTAAEAGLSRAADEKILDHCLRSGRALVTRDKDFGNLAVARAIPCRGVILIRSEPARISQAHLQLRAALSSLSSLDDVFVVVEETRYRIRRLGPARGQSEGPAPGGPGQP